MSKRSKREYSEAIKLRYQKGSKREKTLILDEFCKTCGYNRKYAIRILNKGVGESRALGTRKGGAGRPMKYGHPAIREFLITTWKAANLPCSKRLRAMIPIWLPWYEQTYQTLAWDIKKLILSISAATIDRLFHHMRNRYKKHGLSTTKPGSILKEFIPIKTDQWNESRPGFLEADTVAHCGSSMAGMFVFTVNLTDIATGWSVQRAVWGKGERNVFEAIADVEAVLPFRILGFDCDNGGELLNWHLLKYFKNRKNPAQYTRSREYHKNDNAHIEAKNWTLVRQYLGYERFDNPQCVGLMNHLYSKELYQLVNFFISSFKLIDKKRIGSKIKKIHDTPKTPYQRLMESGCINEKVKRNLTAIFKQLNPYRLQIDIKIKIKKILDIATLTN